MSTRQKKLESWTKSAQSPIMSIKTTINFSIFKPPYLRGRHEKQIWPKVRHCLTRPRPPLPPVKSDTLLKNIFIAFLNSTAFVCYFEMILFFSHPKIRRKTQRNFDSLVSQRQREISLSSDPPTYSGQNIFMCLLHVLEHFKHFK